MAAAILSLDPVFLSRIQFGFVISFHIIFPAFTIMAVCPSGTIALSTGS